MFNDFVEGLVKNLESLVRMSFSMDRLENHVHKGRHEAGHGDFSREEALVIFIELVVAGENTANEYQKIHFDLD